MTQETFPNELRAVLGDLEAMLLEKNRAYGDSALSPIRVFSKAGADEQIRVRLDDKLNRIQKGHEIGTEDTELDLLGYLILLRIHARRFPKEKFLAPSGEKAFLNDVTQPSATKVYHVRNSTRLVHMGLRVFAVSDRSGLHVDQAATSKVFAPFHGSNLTGGLMREIALRVAALDATEANEIERAAEASLDEGEQDRARFRSREERDS